MRPVRNESLIKAMRITLIAVTIALFWVRFVIADRDVVTTDAGQAMMGVFIVAVLTMIGSNPNRVVLFFRWCALGSSLSALAVISAVDMSLALKGADVQAGSWQLDYAALMALTLLVITEIFGIIVKVRMVGHPIAEMLIPQGDEDGSGDEGVDLRVI